MARRGGKASNKRAGRKRDLVEREPNGRAQRDTAAHRREMRSVGIQARQRVLGLSAAKSADNWAGCALGLMLLQNPTHPQRDRSWWQAGLDFEHAYRDYSRAKLLGRPRSSADFTGPAGFDNMNGDEPNYVDWYNRVTGRYRTIRAAILECGDPNAMMAIEGVVLEGVVMPKSLGSLRMALNAVNRAQNVLDRRRNAA